MKAGYHTASIGKSDQFPRRALYGFYEAVQDSTGRGLWTDYMAWLRAETAGKIGDLDHGLEWKDGLIYIASPPSQFVHVVEASTWKEVHRFKAPGYRVHGIAFAEEEGHMWVSDTSFGVVCRQRIEDGRTYDVFRVPHPVQVHGMTIKDNRLWYADDRGPIGWLSVSMEPDF